MKIQVDKTKKIPLYKQIVEQIQAQITSGEIPDGFQFPSERQLADALGVNRTTVLNAYKELKADGLMASHVGRGTVAVSTAGEYPVKTIYQKEPIWEFLYSDYLKNHEPFDVNKYLEIANQKDVISFAAGIASFENLPTQAFEGIEAELLSRQKELLVSPVAGFSSLRKVISTYMQKRSCFCQPSEIMVLSGSQQGIDLITRAFINPGDLILIEEPSFFPAIQSFRAAGAKIMAVPMENDGMDMEILEQLLSRYRPKFLYTMPAYHNPTGICMSLAKRIRLLELVNKYGIPVLEDDPYGELYFEGQPLSPPEIHGQKRICHVSFHLLQNHFPRTASRLDLHGQKTDTSALQYPPASRPAFQLHFPAGRGAFYRQRRNGRLSHPDPQGI